MPNVSCCQIPGHFCNKIQSSLVMLRVSLMYWEAFTKYTHQLFISSHMPRQLSNIAMALLNIRTGKIDWYQGFRSHSLHRRQRWHFQCRLRRADWWFSEVVTVGIRLRRWSKDNTSLYSPYCHYTSELLCRPLPFSSICKIPRYPWNDRALRGNR